MITIIGYNKDGTDKTTIAINVAVGLKMEGYDVFLVDTDVQHSAARWYAEREQAELVPTVMLIEKRQYLAGSPEP